MKSIDTEKLNYISDEHWRNFIVNLKRDFIVFLFFIVFFTLYRFVLFFIFSDKNIIQYSPNDLAQVLYIGFRFDLIPSTIIAIISFVPNLLILIFSWGYIIFQRYFRKNGNEIANQACNNECCTSACSTLCTFIRNSVINIACPITLFLAMANLFFFQEYKSQFNHWVLGMVYDDQIAIFKTLWQDSPVIWFLIALIIGSWCMIKSLKWLTKRVTIQNTAPTHKFYRFAIVTLLIILIIGGLRGGYRNRPMQIQDIDKTQDTFLNQIIPNYYKCLQSAIVRHLKTSDSKKLPYFIPDKNILRASEITFGKQCESISDCLKTKTSTAGIIPKPRHIFLLVLESYDLWPFLEPYSQLGLVNYGTKFANKGLFYTNFISAGHGTTSTISAILSGLPQTDLPLTWQNQMSKTVPTSLAETFKTLGYKTKFFYSGYLTWQNIGTFTSNQGFDEIIGANKINPNFPFGDWGVPDGDTFNYLYENTLTEQVPTFNVVLSLSYHRPFKIDIAKEGYKPGNTSKVFDKLKLSHDTDTAFGHLWYEDKVMGEFIEKMEKKYPDSLFIITGDHWSRQELKENRGNIKYRNAVPLIIYNKKLFKHKLKSEKLKTAGDSLDIAPTIVELIAPKNFEYSTYGKSLLNDVKTRRGKNVKKAQKSSLEPFGAGGVNNAIVTNDFWFEIDNLSDIYFVEENKNTPVPEERLKNLLKRSNARRAIAWWQVMRGDKLK